MRGWQSAAERRIETEIWNNVIEERENLNFEFDSSQMFERNKEV
jgi:hypothetical protein